MTFVSGIDFGHPAAKEMSFGSWHLFVAAGKIGHDWKNPEAYDADDGSVMDW